MRLLRLGLGLGLMCSVCACMAQSTSAPATTAPTTQPNLSHLPADIREVVQLYADLKALHASGTAKPGEEELKMREINGKLLPLGYKYKRADFEITGTVVDEDDNPLEGVRLSVEADVEAIPNFITHKIDGGSRERFKVAVDKNFKVNYQDKSCLKLQFFKEGYLPSGLNPIYASAPIGRVDLDRMLAGGMYQPGVVKQDHKVVMCKPIVPSPTVAEGYGGVGLTPQNPVGYVILGESRLEDEKWVLTVGTRTADDKTPLPKDALVFRIPLTADGKSVSISPLSKDKNIARDLSYFPTWFEMETVGDESGLMRFSVNAWRVRNVPEKGYERVVRLAEQDIIASKITTYVSGEGPLYAFRRTDGKYGWYQIYVKAVSTGVRVGVSVYFQKDGTRYVPKPAPK